MWTDRQIDRHGEASRHIFATYSCECAQRDVTGQITEHDAARKRLEMGFVGNQISCKIVEPCNKDIP
jgi:hypothetical protein